ncbi:helix-turn-helix domain-containing protein [Vreelandella arctica]|uniref:helix-turn-helix domain-containing protein n=1 Tax=Vreelandella arctica TaxID=3126499 RepID=UPI00300E568D
MEGLAEALGKKIRKTREQKGLTQDNVALASRIDRSYMGRIERGEVNITVEKLYEIAEVLGCEPASLLPPKATS